MIKSFEPCIGVIYLASGSISLPLETFPGSYTIKDIYRQRTLCFTDANVKFLSNYSIILLDKLDCVTSALTSVNLYCMPCEQMADERVDDKTPNIGTIKAL